MPLDSILDDQTMWLVSRHNESRMSCGREAARAALTRFTP
jgi:hypothetical protein